MNAIIGRTSEARALAAGIILAVVVVFGGGPASARAADATPVPSEAESLAVIRQNAPAVARAIDADKELRSVVGADKWPLALHRLAEFSEKTDADHQDALRIIGDTIARVKNPIATITLDGDPSEWSGAIPRADAARHRHRERLRAFWAKGAAAVVRRDRLHLMVGLADAAKYFARPGNQLRLTIDCQGDQAWDIGLSISMHKGAWIVKQKAIGFKGPRIKALPTPQAAIGTVAEVAIAISDFVPLTEAKPIWTMYLEAESTSPNGSVEWLRTEYIHVFNENAMEGVAAWPYVRTFVCLCADKPLEGFELTAAAIAMMSSAMYNNSDEEVRTTIRVDNADFLELARSIDAWQTQIGTEYRLKAYPLEAQLAWAARFRADRNNSETNREPGNTNNLENYYWISTSVETLKKLKVLAIKEGRTHASVAECGKRIDDWVRLKQVEPYNTTTAPHSIATDSARKMGLHEAARKAREEELKAIAGFGSHHAETVLKQIETHGYIIGSCGCGQHNRFCQNLMRALGIAPLGFWVVNSREGKHSDHAWPAWYDPARNVWLSYQAGRGEENKRWYLFTVRRPHVFSYAAEAVASYATAADELDIGKSNTGLGPFPLVFCRELRGRDVPKLSHTGIPTKEIREWMLTPGF